MQTQQTITFFGTVSNSATSRTSKTGRKYTAFGVAMISDRNLQAFHYNVVALGKPGDFAKQLQTGNWPGSLFGSLIGFKRANRTASLLAIFSKNENRSFAC